MPVPSGAVGTLFLMVTSASEADADPVLYSTGLQARTEVKGEIACVGHPEERLNRRGLRVWPSDLAKLLRGVAGIDDAVVGIDPVSPQALVAYVVLSRGAARPQVVAEVQGLLVRILPPALRPAALVALPRWPIGTDGSIARAALPAPTEADSLQSQPSDGSRLSHAKKQLLARRLQERSNRLA